MSNKSDAHPPEGDAKPTRGDNPSSLLFSSSVTKTLTETLAETLDEEQVEALTEKPK